MSVVRTSIMWLLIVFGTVEAVWGLLQVYGYEPSNHSLYALTGSFYNPGPYSGFLAMCLPVALHEWLEGKRVWKHLALAAWVLMLVVLPSGMSRSAWVAALVASGYVWAMHYPKAIARYWKAFLAGGVLLILLGIGAYHWKKDSADGRLLMWKIAAQTMMERPDVFPKEKLEWAARMVLEKKAKVESTAIRQMREEVKIMLEEKE